MNPHGELRPHHYPEPLTPLSSYFKPVWNEISFPAYAAVIGTQSPGGEGSTGTSYRIVPARRGLKAYNQSFMSLSLRACKRTPRCFVHTAKVLGV